MIVNVDIVLVSSTVAVVHVHDSILGIVHVLLHTDLCT